MNANRISLPEVVGGGYGEFWRFKGRYRIVKGSRASKKSKTTALDFITKMMKYPEANLLVVRKTERTLKASCYTELKWAIHRLGVDDFWKATVNPLEITYLPTGQKIYFRGLDESMKVTSITVDVGCLCWLWIEEAYEVSSEADFDMLDESIRGAVPDGLYKQITLTFNPWSEKTWIRKRFFCDIVGKDSQGEPIYKEREGHVSADGQILAITTTYQCNEWLDENDLQLFEEMKKNRPKRYWVAGLGNWGVAEGLIYENVEEREFDRYQLVKDRPKLKAAFGLDFGYTNDPSALFCSLVDMDTKEIFVFDELYEKGLGNEELYGRIVNMGYGKERIIADSAEPKSIDRLRDLGLYRIRPAKKGADSIINGISYVQEFKIIVHPRCVNFLTEIGLYQWDEDKFGKRVNKPIDEWNHCLTGDTIVNTVEGDIRISELVGKCGYVKCFDEKSGLPTIGNFHDVRMTRNNAKVFKISLEDGSCINATADHPVLTRNGWKTVCELTCDDEILQVIAQKPCKDFAQEAVPEDQIRFVKIKSIDFISEEPVYNMEVENHHNFCVNGGFVVHNCMDAMRYAISSLSRGSTYSFD